MSAVNSRTIRRLMALLGGVSCLFASVTSVAQNSDLCAVKFPECKPNVDISRSLVVTDEALDGDKFSFDRTISTILNSLGVDPTTEHKENFLRTLLTSFGSAELVNEVSGLRVPVEVRQAEANLQPAELLDPDHPRGLVPVGLFNRFDLMPDGSSNCGEHRIVYSFKAADASTDPRSRLFLIFEARLNNADSTGLGFEGCRPVAEFWRSLSDIDDASERANKLEEFYYDGLPGVAGPVVDARNLGGPLGQIRGNLFVNGFGPTSWALREWIVVGAGSPTPARFVPVTVKDNPFVDLYRDDVEGALDPQRQETVRVAFQADFSNRYVERLTEPESLRGSIRPDNDRYDPCLDPTSEHFDKTKYANELLTTFAARFDNVYNDFESIAMSEERPVHQASAAIKEAVRDSTGSMEIPEAIIPAPDHILNRAGVLTCGGCHQFSQGQEVGQLNGAAIIWPDSARGGFVHIREDGELSLALTDLLLPARAESLRTAVCTPPTTAPVVASASEIGVLARQMRAQRLLTQWSDAAAFVDDESSVLESLTEVITDVRIEEAQLPGYFVVNRRTH